VTAVPPEGTDVAARFQVERPLVPIEDDEVFIPPTVEELAKGEQGTIVKEADVKPSLEETP